MSITLDVLSSQIVEVLGSLNNLTVTIRSMEPFYHVYFAVFKFWSKVAEEFHVTDSDKAAKFTMIQILSMAVATWKY